MSNRNLIDRNLARGAWWLILIAVLTIIFLLSSCASPAKQMRRLIAENPHLVQHDTVHVYDTIITPAVEVTDTVTLRSSDTVYIDRDRLHVRMIRHVDTFTIAARCDPDTVRVNIEVPVSRVVPCPPGEAEGMAWWWPLIIGLVGGLWLASRK